MLQTVFSSLSVSEGCFYLFMMRCRAAVFTRIVTCFQQSDTSNAELLKSVITFAIQAVRQGELTL